ncbi:sel1 repeat family protein [Streptomyces griseus]|uniref:sel1 repeat family protein n=1 Tax=Streptomyces griseus TaxID=1911 RepID=UPI0013BCFF1D|nr:sel1 repeat family protein [Streptomyces griseus]
MDSELEALADRLTPLIMSAEPHVFEAVKACLHPRPVRFQAARLDRMHAMYHGGIPGGADGARGLLLAVLGDVRRVNPAGFARLKEEAADFTRPPTSATTRKRPSPVARQNAFQAAREHTPTAVAAPAAEAASHTAHNAVSGGVLHGPVVQAGTVAGGVHTYYTHPPHSAAPPVSEWLRLDAADPIDLGVWRPRRLPGESLLPPYAARHCDHELGERVREATASGGLVVVTGAPLSGKTRTLWAALTTNLPGTRQIFAPEHGTDLRGLPALVRGRRGESPVLWLDRLEGHLGEHGLTPAVLADLVRLRVPVLATMDDEAYDARRFGTSDRARVLDGIEPVELNRVWSDRETRCLDAPDGDARLRSAALRRGVHTVPEYLAVGPGLVEEWRRAGRLGRHPRGHLLVRAAVDLTLCGVPVGGITGTLLRGVECLYSAELAAAARTETFDEGLAWAAAPRHGVSGLLAPGEGEDTWDVFGALPADAVDRSDHPPVPLSLWSIAITKTTSKDVRATMRANAHAHLADRAENEPEAAYVLASVNGLTGEPGAAEFWLRRAADAGHIESAAMLGELLIARSPAEATGYLETAAEAGLVKAQYLLGVVLADRARHWMSRAAEKGYRPAQRALPALRGAAGPPPGTVGE